MLMLQAFVAHMPFNASSREAPRTMMAGSALIGSGVASTTVQRVAGDIWPIFARLYGQMLTVEGSWLYSAILSHNGAGTGQPLRRPHLQKLDSMGYGPRFIRALV